jgi:hypothetical protein
METKIKFSTNDGETSKKTTVIARQQLRKNATISKLSHAVMEELVEAVFSVRSVQSIWSSYAYGE